ncbi:UPF0547 protein C16orf87 homolog [Mesoplodon densirostris]|uniref:UPF0547 protein C16orf87 homolog n=1 Tax=Mesoplodon densirostris TaxID=48708 RepID=UPI0028DB98AC|nr:UPF0547 protein C16orf87 homolog [Mesoplodon densirostris]
MSATRAKKVKMATKSCSECDQQVPVACKSCSCGYVFINRKLVKIKHSEKSSPFTGGPGKECGTNKLLPTGRIRERSKGERRLKSICPANLPESFSLESILAEQCTCHQEGP